MTEPDFLSQCGHTPKSQRMAWWSARAREATAQGATHMRVAVHETIPDLILFEGWKIRPEDEGEPRWQLALLP